MKKIITNILFLILYLIFGFFILKYSKEVINSIHFSYSIWLNNIFPTLFPFFILSHFLIKYGFVEIISEILKPVVCKLFKTAPAASFVFIMSLVSGFPSNAKYTKELYQNKIITADEATKILTFTHFSNPLFILGTVSLLFLKNRKVGFLILSIHYLTNILIGLIFRNYSVSKQENTKIYFKNIVNRLKQDNPSFGSILSEAIKNTMQTLFLILGTITTFLIINTIINQLFSFSSYYQAIFSGIMEMTQGLKYTSLLSVSLRLKATLMTMILSFGGLSVHMQVLSIISNTKIKYLPFFTARLLHCAVSGILVFYLFPLL